MSNSIGVSSTVGSACRTSLRCGSICRGPKSSGASAEAATVEKSATEARAVTVFAKMASSPSLKDKIINFPCGSPPSYSIDAFIMVQHSILEWLREARHTELQPIPTLHE